MCAVPSRKGNPLHACPGGVPAPRCSRVPAGAGTCGGDGVGDRLSPRAPTRGYPLSRSAARSLPPGPFPAGRAPGAGRSPVPRLRTPVPRRQRSGQGQAGANPRFRVEVADSPSFVINSSVDFRSSPGCWGLFSLHLPPALGVWGGGGVAAPRITPPPCQAPAGGSPSLGSPAGCCAGADVAQRRGVSHLCAGALPPPPRPAPCVVLSYSWIWFNNRSNFALPPPFFFFIKKKKKRPFAPSLLAHRCTHAPLPRNARLSHLLPTPKGCL